MYPGVCRHHHYYQCCHATLGQVWNNRHKRLIINNRPEAERSWYKHFYQYMYTITTVIYEKGAELITFNPNFCELAFLSEHIFMLLLLCLYETRKAATVSGGMGRYCL